MHAPAMPAASRDEFVRVVAVRAADHDDNLGLLRQFDCGELTLFGGLAHGVDESDFRLGKALANERNQPVHLIDGLRRLGRDADSRARSQTGHVLLGQHHVKVGEVFGQPAHFDVVALADDNRVEPLRDQLGDGPMGVADQRTGGLDDPQPAIANAVHRFLRCAVGGNHHGGRGHVGDLVLGSYSLRTKILENGLIVHQVAQNRDRPRLAKGQGDRVADAETHAQMGCAEDLHGTALSALLLAWMTGFKVQIRF